MAAATAIDTARKALDLAWDGNLPVDPEAIAAQLLVTNESTGEQEYFPIQLEGRAVLELDKLSGFAEFVSDGDHSFYRCVFNADEAHYRQRFTKAHELGHVLLGHVAPGKKPKRDTTFNAAAGDWDEVDANAFAAELIMPETYIRHEASKTSNISALADTFGVSPTAIRFRLKKLGLL